MEAYVNPRASILVVDDDSDLLLLMEHKLAAEDFSTLVSLNGSNMIDLIIHCHPDLILLDLHMDGVDGKTICQLIKSNQSTAGIPVILFSANEDVEDISHVCGADGFIKKPFNAAKFKETFGQVLKDYI